MSTAAAALSEGYLMLLSPGGNEMNLTCNDVQQSANSETFWFGSASAPPRPSPRRSSAGA